MDVVHKRGTGVEEGPVACPFRVRQIIIIVQDALRQEDWYRNSSFLAVGNRDPFDVTPGQVSIVLLRLPPCYAGSFSMWNNAAPSLSARESHVVTKSRLSWLFGDGTAGEEENACFMPCGMEEGH